MHFETLPASAATTAEKLFIDVSARAAVYPRRRTLENRRHHSESSAEESRGKEKERERRPGVRMLSRRLIYGRNDRTDSRKLRVVSHNLGIRSPPTSTGNRAGRARWRRRRCAPRYIRAPYECRLFIKQRVCATSSRARKLHPHTSAPESNFTRAKDNARRPAACRYPDNARIRDRLTARTEACLPRRLAVIIYRDARANLCAEGAESAPGELLACMDMSYYVVLIEKRTVLRVAMWKAGAIETLSKIMIKL